LNKAGRLAADHGDEARHPSTNEKENPMKVKYSEFDSKGRLQVA